jgi:hypothetical protein
LQDNHRATRLVVRCVEPVAEIKGCIAVRLVTTLVVEVVHRNGKIICRVEVAWVDVFALEQGCALGLCKWSVTV